MSEGAQTEARLMTDRDLGGVAAYHHACFPESLFTRLGTGATRCYYAQAIHDPSAVAVVLVETGSGRVAGAAIGTTEPGFRKRMMKRYPCTFARALVWGVLTNSEVRRGLRKRSDSGSMHGESGEDVLAQFGIASPKGPEAFFMLVGVHPECRGGGNAEKLVRRFAGEVFERLGAGRIRGSVRADNLASLIMHKRLGWESVQISEHDFAVWIDREAFARQTESG